MRQRRRDHLALLAKGAGEQMNVMVARGVGGHRQPRRQRLVIRVCVHEQQACRPGRVPGPGLTAHRSDTVAAVRVRRNTRPAKARSAPTDSRCGSRGWTGPRSSTYNLPPAAGGLPADVVLNSDADRSEHDIGMMPSPKTTGTATKPHLARIWWQPPRVSGPRRRWADPSRRYTSVRFSGKWQATRCPGAISTGTGISVVHRSCALGQRVRKTQPDGGFCGLGSSP